MAPNKYYLRKERNIKTIFTMTHGVVDPDCANGECILKDIKFIKQNFFLLLVPPGTFLAVKIRAFNPGNLFFGGIFQKKLHVASTSLA